MGEARVCGTSEQARGLKNIMNQTVQKIESDINNMEKAVRQIHDGWDDDGVNEVDEILAAIRNALKGAQDAMPNVANALEAYAQFLDER